MLSTLIAVFGRFNPKQQFVIAEWPMTLPHERCNYFSITLFQPELKGWHFTAALYADDVPQQYVLFEESGLVQTTSLNEVVNVVPNMRLILTGINGAKPLYDVNIPLLAYISYFPDSVVTDESRHEYVEVVPGGALFSRVSGHAFSNTKDYSWEKPANSVERHEMDTLELQSDGSLIWNIPYPDSNSGVELTTVYTENVRAQIQGVSAPVKLLYTGRFSNPIGATVAGRAYVKFNSLADFIVNYSPTHATVAFKTTPAEPAHAE